MHTETYAAQGMTCGSCIAEVMELVRTLPGLSGVSVAYGSFVLSWHTDSLADVDEVWCATRSTTFARTAGTSSGPFVPGTGD